MQNCIKLCRNNLLDKLHFQLIPWKNDQADPKLQLRQFVDRLTEGKGYKI